MKPIALVPGDGRIADFDDVSERTERVVMPAAPEAPATTQFTLTLLADAALVEFLRSEGVRERELPAIGSFYRVTSSAPTAVLAREEYAGFTINSLRMESPAWRLTARQGENGPALREEWERVQRLESAMHELRGAAHRWSYEYGRVMKAKYGYEWERGEPAQNADALLDAEAAYYAKSAQVAALTSASFSVVGSDVVMAPAAP